MWPDVPETQVDLDALQRKVLGSRLYYGSLVSLDQKATLVAGGFFEEHMEPKQIYATLDALVKKETDANTRVYVIGRPMLLGDIATKSPRLGLIMLVTATWSAWWYQPWPLPMRRSWASASWASSRPTSIRWCW
jgi:hypothetical protein